MTAHRIHIHFQERRLSAPALPAAMLALLLFAFAVLMLTLQWQSLWLDEVYSLWYVNRNFDDAWQKAIFPEQNPHATLYYLLMWAWVKAFGVTDLAARMSSLIFGMLSLALGYRLARDWTGSKPALLFALLMAVSPFAIWHGQEARQYALYLCLGLLSTLALSRAIGLNARAPRWRPGYALLYIVSAVAMAYSHYFSVFVIAAQFAGALIVLVRAPRRLLPLLLMGVVVAALCLPIPWRLLQSGRTFDRADITRAFMPPQEMLASMLEEYITRVAWPANPILHALLLAVPALLLALGLVFLFRRNWRLGAFVMCLALLPALLYLPISTSVSIFTPKYVMASFPFFLMALAVGLNAVLQHNRALGAALVVAVIALFSAGTLRDLTQPDFQRENWRFAGDFLKREATADDAVLVFADYAAPVLAHYYDDGAEIIPFAGDPGNPAPAFDFAQQRARRMLWLVLSHDQNAYPNHTLLDVAYSRYPWSYAQYPSQGNIRVLGFNTRWRHDALPAGATPVANGRFANGMELIGYSIDNSRLKATDRISHPPSNWIHAVTYWQRWKPIDPAGAQPALRLTSADGGEWGGELSRRPNVFDFDPPEKWGDGDIIEAHYDVNLNPATPAGNYMLEARMLKDDQRLPLDGSSDTWLKLAPIEILP